jgi:endonuclease/exonuclease/phosphatase family metal-dependent hydrolase
VVVLAGCTPAATTSNAAEPNAIGVASGASTSTGRASGGPLRVLQMNLCNSGIASCYTGRAVTQAATVIRTEAPDVVTLNEICQIDLSTLQRALLEASPGARVVSAFQAARDRRTGEAYRCRNGQPYGIGLISRWPSVPGSAADAGIYPSQDTDDPEERAWLCLQVAASPTTTVCTTHLDDTKRAVAAAQCRYVFGTVIAKLRTQDPAGPVVLGGDLNLGSGDTADLRSCLSVGSAVADDGGVQHVVATPEFVVSSSQRIDMRGATDHPALLVTLSPARLEG